MCSRKGGQKLRRACSIDTIAVSSYLKEPGDRFLTLFDVLLDDHSLLGVVCFQLSEQLLFPLFHDGGEDLEGLVQLVLGPGVRVGHVEGHALHHFLLSPHLGPFDASLLQQVAHRPVVLAHVPHVDTPTHSAVALGHVLAQSADFAVTASEPVVELQKKQDEFISSTPPSPANFGK